MCFSSTNRKRKHNEQEAEDCNISKRHKTNQKVNIYNILPLHNTQQKQETNPRFNAIPSTIWETNPAAYPPPNSNINNNSMDNKTSDTEEDLDLLLYQLANLEVNNDQNSLQRCPICTIKISDDLFAKHVYDCLDKMDVNDRSDLKFQINHDKKYAEQLSTQDGYTENFIQHCPICNKTLELGSGINVHINNCLDQQNLKSENKDNGQVKGLNASQMISCANALMKEQKGSDSYSQMLDMFNHLGFNARNIKNVIRRSVSNVDDDDDGRKKEERFRFQFHPKSLLSSVNNHSFQPSPLILPVSASVSNAVSMNLNVDDGRSDGEDDDLQQIIIGSSRVMLPDDDEI